MNQCWQSIDDDDDDAATVKPMIPPIRTITPSVFSGWSAQRTGSYIGMLHAIDATLDITTSVDHIGCFLRLQGPAPSSKQNSKGRGPLSW